MAAEPAKLDIRRLHHGMAPTWFGLVCGSWLGLLWATVLTGGGAAVAAGVGVISVPLWGTFWGFRGMKKARDAAIRKNRYERLPDDHPLTVHVHQLADRLGLPAKPWVALMGDENAYAIGSSPENALVVIGRPLADKMTAEQLASIIGHELGHIANNDMRRMTMARSFQNSLVWYLGWSRTVQGFGRWFLTWGSELLVLGLSRKREYWADAIGAALTSKEAMIGALERLHDAPPLSDFEKANARLMFRGVTNSFLATHPTLDERRNALAAETYLRQLPTIGGTWSPPVVSAAPVEMPSSLPVGRHAPASEVAYAKPPE